MTSENQPKISYIVAVYNGERFIERCLQSILRQSFSDVEVLFVDDGSEDSSASILVEVAQKHSNCHVFAHENRGCSAARNTAIKEARGEFVAILDVDDIAIGERSRLQYQAAIDSNADLVVGGSLIIDADRQKTGSYMPPSDTGKIFNALLKRKAAFHHSSCLMKTSTMIALGGYNERLRLGGDLELFYRLFESGTVSVVREFLVEHMRHEASLSNGSSLEKSMFIGVFLTACHLLRVERDVHVLNMTDADYGRILNKSKDWFSNSKTLSEFRFRQQLKASLDRGSVQLLRVMIANPVASFASAIAVIRGDTSPRQLFRYLIEAECWQ